MTKPYNRITTKDPVTTGAVATALLTEAEQSLIGLSGVTIQPEGEIRIGDSTITTTKGILIAPYQVLDMEKYVGPLFAISTSGSDVTVQVQLGAS